MRRREFLRFTGLGAVVACLAQIPTVAASTVESCTSALQQIRDVLTGPVTPQEKLDQILAIVDGELGPPPNEISGDFAGMIPAGETWRIVGDVNLTGDLIVEGTLTGVDTFTLEGNGHQIMVMNGGVLDLAGVPRVAWVRWGEPVSGWNTGDLLSVAPTAVDEFTPTTVLWGGSWAATPRPANSPDVPLVDGSTAVPEVVNLSSSLVIRNVSRLMFHQGAGVQLLRHLRLSDSGVKGVLGFYPIHFHLCGETVGGSLVEGVVVERGQNHAFVPHGSHGVTFRDVAAVDGIDDQFWWDQGEENDSHDTLFEHAAVVGLSGSSSSSNARNLTGFKLRGGNNNTARDVVSTGVNGGVLSNGFDWNETGVWHFSDFVSHNNDNHGIRVWTNSSREHDITDGRIYNCGSTAISHGAYLNRYLFRDIVIGGCGVVVHANSKVPNIFGERPIIFERIQSDSALIFAPHNKPPAQPSEFRDISVSEIVYNEGTANPSHTRFIDSGVTPADFNITSIHSGSIIEVTEGGAIAHRWFAGGWE